MLNTTLCYVTRGSQVLMLHRVKKKADINKDKWIGIGGKFEGEESPDECLLREAKVHDRTSRPPPAPSVPIILPPMNTR